MHDRVGSDVIRQFNLRQALLFREALADYSIFEVVLVICPCICQVAQLFDPVLPLCLLFSRMISSS